jgi:hypothetical protein
MVTGAPVTKFSAPVSEWRLRHGLSLTKAAEALGLSRRMVAYYANGEKSVPRAIQLACKGWEAEQAACGWGFAGGKFTPTPKAFPALAVARRGVRQAPPG